MKRHFILDPLSTAERIKSLSIKNNTTAKDIQKALNLSDVQAVYKWFDGTNMPTIDHLVMLSDLWDVPVDEIVCKRSVKHGEQN